MHDRSFIADWYAELGDKRTETVTFYRYLRDGRVSRTRTFAEFDRGARHVAGHLRELAEPGETVILAYPQGLEFIEALLACMYLRLVAVPVPTPDLDPRAFARVVRIVDDTEARFVLTDEATSDSLATWRSIVGPGGAALEVVASDVFAAAKTYTGEPLSTPDDVAVLQYTSGSTSAPKGVMVTQRNIADNVAKIRGVITSSPADFGVSWIPHFHDMGLIGLLLHPLGTGFSTAYMSAKDFVRVPRRWLELMTEHRATLTVSPNFGYELAAKRVGSTGGLDLSTLRAALNGAEPVRAGTMELMRERFAPVGFDPIAWVPCYGMAEATLLITGCPSETMPTVRSFDLDRLATEGIACPVRATEPARILVSVGPIDEHEVIIARVADHTPAPEGVVGEIWARNASVARGYRGDDELTATTFHAYTADGRGPFLRTGDLGFALAGELYVTGRLKDILVINGRNVDAIDIEGAALECVPWATGAAAFAFTGDDRAEQAVLTVELFNAGTGPVGLTDLAAEVSAHVNGQHQLGALGVVFAEFGALPRTTSGKVRRAEARTKWLTGALPVLHENTAAADIRLRGAQLLSASATS
ncbi:fatty acyl-AMP ligase [Nocardia sp. BMG51109]|uniref:fatty acyl-AMP ligase n=1 Tax=Nocardia sp. BMG51109 TaxID=1056816 RepID=UPI000464F92C|nr:fatty acyl-AMP ligase [Nocardia sp. BMG51109]